MGRVLIACERSGVVRRAFAALGHKAISVDLAPADDGAVWMPKDPTIGQHWTGDIAEFLVMWKRTRHTMALEGQDIGGFDLAIAHPVCTKLTNAGVRWLHERNQWDEMRQGAAFFNFMKALPAPRIAIENPVMHKYARELCGAHTQTVQPYQFGDEACKRTCWWLTNLPPLVPTTPEVKPPRRGEPNYWKWRQVHAASPGPDRARLRSQFFPGMAAAMAAQWGALL